LSLGRARKAIRVFAGYYDRGVEAVERTADELTARLDEIKQSPADQGTLELIVRRPAEDEREVLDEATLDLEQGLVGDTWSTRGSRSTPDGSSNRGLQLTLMNARAIDVMAGTRDRWPLAGDQLYVDLDLSEENLPPGARLAIGSAVIEVSGIPHTGCGKFSRRFGSSAQRFVNSPVGRALRLRGINAFVVEAGIARQGDTIRKL
jgi:MOSC domain-containing protein YiiM